MPLDPRELGEYIGPMNRVGESRQALHRWLVENGYKHSGPCHELRVRAESQDQQDWLTELQQPIR